MSRGEPALVLRRASPDDVDDLYRALLGIARHVKEEHKVQSTPQDLYHALFDARPALFGVVAELDRSFAGCCLYFPTYSTWLGTRGVYVQDLWVEEAARGRRVGARLLQFVAAQTRAEGAAYMRLAVDTANLAAMTFYEGLGLARSDAEQIHAAYGDAFQALADGGGPGGRAAAARS
jgi:ribosomal protein S18 acetylase RimI-like enzyme